jgi:hypothetical protein
MLALTTTGLFAISLTTAAPVWADGVAIAVNRARAVQAHGPYSFATAEQRAMALCQSSGPGCVLVASAASGCVAIASATATKWAGGTGPDIRSAEAAASRKLASTGYGGSPGLQAVCVNGATDKF